MFAVCFLFLSGPYKREELRMKKMRKSKHQYRREEFARRRDAAIADSFRTSNHRPDP